MFQESVLWHCLSLSGPKIDWKGQRARKRQIEAELSYNTMRGWVAVAHPYDMVVIVALSEVLIVYYSGWG